MDEKIHVQPSEHRWNIWRVMKDGTQKWVGSILDPKTAFTWIKGRQGEYRVNNVPPTTGRTPNPAHEIIATSPTDFRKGADLPPKEDAARPQPVRRVHERIEAPKKTSVPPQRRHKDQDSAEQRKLRQDAAKRLAKHRADEAADLAAEEDGKG